MEETIKSVHEGKIFQCEICSTKFTQRVHFEKHIESVYEWKVFKCDIFSFSFTKNGILKNQKGPSINDVAFKGEGGGSKTAKNEATSFMDDP